jgi:SAM-dependent methyltransferase
VAFNVAADAYDRFMGRYSTLLSPRLVDLAGVRGGERVLDVGCGPGALTAELARRLGAGRVTAVDPSEHFVAVARARHPGVDVRLAAAEALPFDDGTYDAALAQLVVHFMADPVAGLSEMARVTRDGGVVAACVWDVDRERGPLGTFWAAARTIDASVAGESPLPGAREGHLAELFASAGLRDIVDTEIAITLEHPTFEDWWDPFELGVGPAGAYTQALDPERRLELREACRRLLPEPPFRMTAAAWSVRGIA